METTNYTSYIPLFAVLVSLVAVLPIILSRKFQNLREFWTIAASLMKFGLVLSLLPAALKGLTARIDLIDIAPGLKLSLAADPFGVFFAIVASGLWILTSFYSIGYVRGLSEHKQTRYFASFAICLSATIGIAFSANLFTFLIFYEILTIATYPLVIHKETPKAISAGRKYLVYTLSAGLSLIAATAITQSVAHTLDFKAGGLFADGQLSSGLAIGLFLLFLGGVGVKAGIMPLHSWLPTAMAAPTPVSALLHAVAVVKSGVFGVIRVVGFVFGPVIMKQFGLSTILMVFAGTTIIVASLLAFRQDNLKRRLAYSTVGHLSYIVMGAALLTPAAFTGAILHISFHATMKITLFFVAGAIYVAKHKENISDLDGIGRAMPFTMGAFAIGAMGLAGIPPINGFISKWYLVKGSLQADMMVPVAIFVLSGILNVAYLFPIIYRAFFKKSDKYQSFSEAPKAMVIPIVCTMLLSIALGLYPNLFFDLFDLARSIALSITGGI
jgi:multicomponent Na+:H+ antiporter subunit D